MAKAATLSDSNKQLLISRSEAAHRLGCCAMTLIRLQNDGVLTPIRLSRKATGRVFYRVAQIEALATHGAARA
jgi:hypothetical protein